MSNVKKILSLLLCFVMLFSMLPTAFAEGEQEEATEEVSVVAVEEEGPVEVESEEPEPILAPENTETAEPQEPAQNEAEETANNDPVEPENEDSQEPVNTESFEQTETEPAAPIHVVFQCEPKETVIRIYYSDIKDENGLPLEIKAEADGLYLLFPGEYLYDAECEGYEKAEKEKFTVDITDAPLEIPVMLKSSEMIQEIPDNTVIEEEPENIETDPLEPSSETRTIGDGTGDWSNGVGWWSQSQSTNYWFQQYGCLLVAQSKMLVISGGASSDWTVFNPEIYWSWSRANGYTDDELYTPDKTGPVAYAALSGVSMTYEGVLYENNLNKVWENINAGKYTIICVYCPNQHFVLVNNGGSQETGTLRVFDSWTTGRPGTRDFQSNYINKGYNISAIHTYSVGGSIPHSTPTVSVSVNWSKPTVSWNSVGANSYHVYISNRDTGVNLTGPNVGTALTYTWPDQLPAGNYTAIVTAYFSDGDTTGRKDFTVHAAPTVTVSENGGKPVIGWNNVGANSYRVYIRDMDNNVNLDETNVGKVFSYTWPNQLPAGNYRAYVTAIFGSEQEQGYKDFSLYETPTVGVLEYGGNPIISWNDVGASSYSVYIHDSDNNIDLDETNVGKVFSYYWPDQLPAGNYIAYVTAHFSNVKKTGYKEFIIHGAPTVTLSLNGAIPSFSWNDVGADYYCVKIFDNDNYVDIGETNVGTALSYTWPEEIPAGNYTGIVGAYWGSYHLSGSKDFTIHVAPTVQVAENEGIVTISWNDVGATSYNVSLYDNANNVDLGGTSTGTDLSYTWPSQLSAGNYTVTVIARFSDGNSTGSKDFTIHAAPYVQVAEYDDRVTFKWTDVGATSYNVSLHDNDNNVDLGGTNVGTALSLTWPWQLPVGHYTVTVIAGFSDGSKTSSKDFTVHDPLVVEVTDNEGIITISWNDVEAAWYTFVLHDNDNNVDLGGTDLSDLSVTWPKALPAGNYTVTVRATLLNFEDGHKTAYKDFTIHASPTVTVSVNTGIATTISWTDVGATSYYVYIHDTANNTDLPGENVGTALSYTWPYNLPEGNYTAYVSSYWDNSTHSSHSDFIVDHAWNAPVYVWPEDMSSVTATRVCARNSSHVETETANTVLTYIIEPDCEMWGMGHYTPNFTNPVFAENWFNPWPNMAIEPTGHTWGEAEYTWLEANSIVVAERVCTKDSSHVETETVETTSVSSIDGTDLVTTWTATFTNEAFETQTKEERSALHISRTNLDLYVDYTDTLLVIAQNGSVAEVSWVSSKPEVASVTEAGVVRGLKSGFTTVSALDGQGNTIASCAVRVLFTDVADPSRYFYEPVYWALENNITTGAGGPGLFSPDNDCTREQVVTFLWRLFGSPEPKTFTSFTDVPTTAWYYKPICWAAEMGITVGLNDGTGRFGVGQSCTRAMCVTFLWRAAGKPAPATQGNFTDLRPGAYYIDAVSWAAENNITVGLNDGTGRFGINNSCTRAMIVTFLYRFAHRN